MIKFTWLKRAVVAVIGFTVLLIVVAVVLPGPAVLVIPLGLAILATEFVWGQTVVRESPRDHYSQKREKTEPSKAADDQIEPLISNRGSAE